MTSILLISIGLDDRFVIRTCSQVSLNVHRPQLRASVKSDTAAQVPLPPPMAMPLKNTWPGSSLTMSLTWMTASEMWPDTRADWPPDTSFTLTLIAVVMSPSALTTRTGLGPD